MSIDEQESSRGSDNKIPSSLGAWLKQAREEAGFTIDEIARALKLAGSTVQDLERDRTDHIGAPIYYKGFVRSYAKILELPEVAVESRLNDLIKDDPMPQVPEGTIRVRRSRWMERYTLMASYVVGTALVLPLLYWLVSSDGAPRLLQEPGPSTVNLPVPEASSVDTPSAAPTAGAAEPAPGDSMELVSAPASDAQVDQPLSPPVAASLTPFGLGRGSAGATNSAQPLALELAQASWVSLVDGKGERVVYRTLQSGRHEFGGEPPLQLRLGNVIGSRLFIAGQAVDLQAYERGNVATLTLANNAQGQLEVQPVAREDQ